MSCLILSSCPEFHTVFAIGLFVLPEWKGRVLSAKPCPEFGDTLLAPKVGSWGLGSLRNSTSPCCCGVLPTMRIRVRNSSRPELCAGFQSGVPGAVGLGLRPLLPHRGEADPGRGGERAVPCPPEAVPIASAVRPSSPCHRAGASVPSPLGSGGGGPDGASLIQQRRRAAKPALGGLWGQGRGASGSPMALPCPGVRNGQRGLRPVLRRAPRGSAASPRPLRGLRVPRTTRPSANKLTAAPCLKRGTPSRGAFRGARGLLLAEEPSQMSWSTAQGRNSPLQCRGEATPRGTPRSPFGPLAS